jgi:outer membrane lipoprotein carrier protein
LTFSSGGLLALSVGLFAASPAWAGELDQKLIESVEAKYSTVSVMKAAFEQTTKSQMFGEEKSSGDLIVKRPSKMRWTFEGDSKQFVTDGKTMWIWSKADNQVIRYDDVSSQASAADSILGSLDQLQELFEVDVVPVDVPGHTLSLTPREEGQFKKVKLVLTDGLVLEQVVITDAFDNVTELTFKDVVLNATVPDSAFEFEVPAGANLVVASQM